MTGEMVCVHGLKGLFLFQGWAVYQYCIIYLCFFF